MVNWTFRNECIVNYHRKYFIAKEKITTFPLKIWHQYTGFSSDYKMHKKTSWPRYPKYWQCKSTWVQKCHRFQAFVIKILQLWNMQFITKHTIYSKSHIQGQWHWKRHFLSCSDKTYLMQMKKSRKKFGIKLSPFRF